MIILGRCANEKGQSDQKLHRCETMTVVRVTRRIQASTNSVWQVLGKYGSVDAFSPHVVKSFILKNGPETGVGAMRQCDLSDGKNHVKERVTEWVDGSFYSVEIYEGTMPITNAYSTVSVASVNAETSDATIEIGYRPKFGLFGALLNAILIKSRLTIVAGDNLAGLKKVVEGRGSSRGAVR
ncbi:SRPBCC family protein [Roseobacteraceae bacterium S113]